MGKHGRTRAFAAAVTFVVLAVAAQLLRQPGARSWNTIWAEDGTLYATDAYAHDAVSTLFRGYAGYAALVPRVIALGVRPLPVTWVAPYLAFAAALVTALLALFVYRSMHGWVRSPWLAWLVSAMTVFAPVLFYEINANIANLGWPLVFASFWAFASSRQGAVDTVLRAIVVALCALTSPVVALLVPWGVAFAVRRRRRADVVVVATAVAALAVQWLSIRATTPGVSGQSTLSDLPVEYGVRVVGSLVFGERWLSRLWSNLGVLLAVIAIAAVVVAVVVAMPSRIAADRRWFAAGAAALSILLFVVPVWIRGSEDMAPIAGDLSRAGSRYVYVPLLILLSGLVVLVDGSERRWLVGAGAAVGALLMVAGFGLANDRSLGPTWSSEIEIASATCRAPGAPPVVSVPITPDDSGWVIAVPCGRLR